METESFESENIDGDDDYEKGIIEIQRIDRDLEKAHALQNALS